MAISACLHANAGNGRVCKVRGHDRRRPSIKRKRRLHHAPVTNRHQLLHSPCARLDQQVDRIASLWVQLPRCVRILCALVTQGLAGGPAFFTSQAHDSLRAAITLLRLPARVVMVLLLWTIAVSLCW